MEHEKQEEKLSMSKQENAYSKDQMIALYVNQMIKLFPNYSDGTDTKTKIRAFQFSLKDTSFEKFSPDVIELFFKDRIKHGKKMPLPCDAVEFCRKKQSHMEYIQSTSNATPLLSNRKPVRRVPWMGMSYHTTMESEHAPALLNHLKMLREKYGQEKADGYIKYLKNHVGLS